MIDLGLINGDTAGTAYSVNAKDQVVGTTVPCAQVNFDDSCDGPVYHSFLWENGSIVDLQTLVVPGSDIAVSSCAGCEIAGYNINDRGEIAGQGVLSNGDSRVILLIPCDENHPDVEGCDYSLVDANNTARPQLAHTLHAGSSLANTSNLLPSQPNVNRPHKDTDRRRKADGFRPN